MRTTAVLPVKSFARAKRRLGDVLGGGDREQLAAAMVTDVLAALQTAELIVIGPSNPVISIGPILAVGEMRAEMRNARVVAVSPLVRGQVLKGPTDAFMEWAGHPLSSDGIAAHYAGLIDGLVADEQATEIPTLVTDVEMGDAAARRHVAEAVLGFT